MRGIQVRKTQKPSRQAVQAGRTSRAPREGRTNPEAGGVQAGTQPSTPGASRQAGRQAGRVTHPPRNRNCSSRQRRGETQKIYLYPKSTGSRKQRNGWQGGMSHPGKIWNLYPGRQRHLGEWQQCSRCHPESRKQTWRPKTQQYML